MKLSEALAAMNSEPKPDRAADEVAPDEAKSNPEEVDDLTAIADELARLAGRRKEIDERVNELKAKVADLGVEVGTTVNTSTGDPAFAVRVTGRRFDPVIAAQVLPDALREMVTIPIIDPKVAKAKLPPEMYSQCMTPGKESVVLK